MNWKALMLALTVAMVFLVVRPVDATQYYGWMNSTSACYGTWNPSYPCSRFFDNDWKTDAQIGLGATYAWALFNFTTMDNGSIFQIRDCGGYVNITIPYMCTTQKPVQFNYTLYNDGINPSWSILKCYNGTSMQTIRNVSACDQTYDKMIFYNITSPLTNCSIGTQSLTLTNLRESNQTSINATLDISFELNNAQSYQYKNMSFSLPSNTTNQICINHPNGSVSYSVNATAVYDAPGYSQRHYYLTNATLSNQTQNINLYLLEDSDSTLIQTQVIDRSINPVSDVVIKAMKYYVGSGSYQTVAEGKTDFNGNDYINLNMYNTWYKFILEKNGVVIASFNPLTIGSTTISLPVGNATRGEYWSYYGTVAYSCYYTNATAVLRCDFSDTSGLMQTITLSVQKFGMASGFTEYCNQSSTSTSATLLCTLDNVGSELYKYTLYANYQGSQFPFHSGDVDLTDKYKPYGDTGVITSIMIIGTLAMMGLPVAAAVLIFTTLAIIMVLLMKLLVIQNIYYSIICLVALVALMIWKLREKGW